jgi:hypothetical protein
MRCRKCGTEIADKALICYRCGTAVDGPAAVPPEGRRPRQSPVLAALALLVLALAALFMGRTATGPLPRALTWGVAGLAVVVAAWRVIAARRAGR